MLKSLQRRVVAVLLFSALLVVSGGMLSSCSGSKGNCNYDASRYRIKSKRSGSKVNSRPGTFKHNTPVRKKWIIDNRRKPVLGQR